MTTISSKFVSILKVGETYFNFCFVSSVPVELVFRHDNVANFSSELVFVQEVFFNRTVHPDLLQLSSNFLKIYTLHCFLDRSLIIQISA